MMPFDLTAIITAHGEGLYAGVTAQSARLAIDRAMEAGRQVETLIVLDNADARTEETLRSYFGETARYLPTAEGDPGCARNRGVEAAQGRAAAFLDADDLWSENWLVEGLTCLDARPDAVFHSACSIAFGGAHAYWWHPDSETALVDPDYLKWFNYWDAMCLARIDVFRAHPFRRNDLRQGFGHEDWLWNRVTLDAGVPHKPVPGTLHFKRRRAGSQSEKVNAQGGVPWPMDG